MATGDLTTVDQYKAARGVRDSLDDAEIARAITVASSWLGRETGRQFWDSGLPTSARVFHPPTDDSCLYVDDFSTTTGLVVVDNTTTLTLGTDFWVEPLNGLTVSGETTAYYKIIRTKGRRWNQPGTGPSVSVTARWGFATVPSIAVQAVDVVIGDLLASRDNTFGVIGIDTGAAIRLRENATVALLMTHFARGDRGRGYGIA